MTAVYSDDMMQDPGEERREPPGQPEEAESGTAEKLGPLLDNPDTGWVAREVVRHRKRDRARKTRMAAYFDRNRLWRAGIRGVQVVDSANPDEVRVWVLPSTTATPPVPNHCDRLIRRAISQITTDPAMAEVQGSTDTPEDRDAAEFAGRLLNQDASGTGLNLRLDGETVLDIAGTYGSGFTLDIVDPKGGGHVPMQIEVHPQATTADEAESGPVGAPPSADFILKYVQQDGSLSAEASNARRRWVPRVVTYYVNPLHVDLLPLTSRGIADAEGAVVVLVETMGRLKALFPSLAAMDAAVLQVIADWVPPGYQPAMLPGGIDRKGPTAEEVGDEGSTPGGPSDDAVAMLLIEYRRSCYQYPWGAMVVVGGGEHVIQRGTWMATMGPDGQKVDEPLEIPLAQCRWLADTDTGNWMGIAPAEKLGPLDELRAGNYGAYLEYLFRFNNPNLFLPPGSIVQPGALGRRDGTPIVVGPEGQPVYETIPAFPSQNGELLDRLTQEENSEVGLEDAAQGVSTPNVTSGTHAQIVVEQALVALSATSGSYKDWFERRCLIRLQLYRAFYTTPQLLRAVEDDGSAKFREWTGADLRSTRDVRVMKGSATMLPASAKAQMIDAEVASGQLLPEEAQRLKRGGVSSMIGRQDDGDYLRVQRQIRTWKDGPDSKADPDSPEGQQAMTEGSQALFAPVPTDAEPMAAKTRWRELREVINSTWLTRFHPAWQSGVLKAYDTARQAAGVQTLAEQQQAAAEQAQAVTAEKAADRAERLAEKGLGPPPVDTTNQGGPTLQAA